MAGIVIDVTQQERDVIYAAIAQHNGETMSVAKITEYAGHRYTSNRVRFIVDDLLEKEKIKRIEVKNFGPRYKRYRYEVTGK